MNEGRKEQGKGRNKEEKKKARKKVKCERKKQIEQVIQWLREIQEEDKEEEKEEKEIGMNDIGLSKMENGRTERKKGKMFNEVREKEWQEMEKVD